MKRDTVTPETPRREHRRVVMRRVDDLVPYAANARTHSPQQIEQIARSIREFGFVNPVLVDGDGGIIAGHGRVLAARSIDMHEVPTIDVHWLTPEQRRAYILADNQIALNAGWDEALLQQELQALRGLEFDLSVIGFDEGQLAALLHDTDGDDDAAQNEDEIIPAVPGRAITVPGDVWKLGRHRVMCGDCRDARDVDRLIGGAAQINIAFTSPPYAEQREYDPSSGFRPIPPDAYVEWFAPCAANVARRLAPDGSFFVNIKPSAEGLDTELYVFDLVIAHVRQWGWHFATEFCWERPGVPKGVTQRFKNQFEPIYQFVRGRWKMRPDAVRHPSDNVPRAGGPGSGNTTWKDAQGDTTPGGGVSGSMGGDYVGPGMAYPGNRLPSFNSSHSALGHAAAFPVGLPAWFLNAYTDPGDTVFDPFCGSGSTLIAAERCERVGFGMELSPAYCDVIVRRWQAFTGQQAIHAEHGGPFPA